MRHHENVFGIIHFVEMLSVIFLIEFNIKKLLLIPIQ